MAPNSPYTLHQSLRVFQLPKSGIVRRRALAICKHPLRVTREGAAFGTKCALHNAYLNGVCLACFGSTIQEDGAALALNSIPQT